MIRLTEVMLSPVFSLKPKESAKELVIPCLPRNDFLSQQGKGDKNNTLDRQAAEEIISGKF